MAFDNEFLSACARTLVTLEKQLTEELTQQQAGTRPVTLDQTQFGRVSRIDAITQQEMHKATAQQTAQRLRKVIKALHKLEEEEYGGCEHCGKDIEKARLNVQPEALYCLSCQDAAERGS